MSRIAKSPIYEASCVFDSVPHVWHCLSIALPTAGSDTDDGDTDHELMSRVAEQARQLPDVVWKQGPSPSPPSANAKHRDVDYRICEKIGIHPLLISCSSNLIDHIAGFLYDGCQSSHKITSQMNCL